MSMKDFLQKQGLMEGAPPTPLPHPHTTHAPAPDAAAPMPFSPGPVYTPPPMQAPPFIAPTNGGMFAAPPVVAPIMDEAAQAQMKTIEAAVYRQQNSPYVIFQHVRASLNNTPDFPSVFKVLDASGSGVTPQKVVASIDDHLSIIAESRKSFENDLAQAKDSQVAKPTEYIANLTKANETAMAQITTNNQKIAELQQTIQHGQTAIQNGIARFKAIEDQLSAPLLQTKQLLATQGA